MSRHSVRSMRFGAAIALGLAGLLLMRPVDAAESMSPEATLQAHLEAGEFAPALNIARQAATREQRDAWLGQVAAAQADAGARSEALSSASQISDDRARTRAVSAVAARPIGGRGGGSQADFDSLINLITSTISPSSWDDVGGPGSIQQFPTGVYVDPQGVLRPVMKQETTGDLAALRAASAARHGQSDARRASPLRMISLSRLEKRAQLLWAAGQPLSEDMEVLAGLQRIKYVFVYPDTGDLVLAGPAGDWKTSDEGRPVSTQSDQPVVRLDDLVVVLRHVMGHRDGYFGCAITPTQQGLARIQEFLAQSQQRPITPGQRKAWLEKLRSSLGQQDIEVNGLDPQTRAARVMVEADYHMKLVGMGLAEGVPGVESYLASVKVPPGQAPPPMGVLRWWFTLNYQAVLGAADRNAFEIRGQGVQVLSENERLTAEGKRVHTGDSEDLNRQFARSFTANFGVLCQKYPVYAELRNLFDLALVGALLREEDLSAKTGWHMTYFGDPQAFRVEQAPAPTKVDSVVNCRVVNRVHILAGVSGGVSVRPAALVARSAIELDRYGALTSQRSGTAPKKVADEAWWWD